MNRNYMFATANQAIPALLGGLLEDGDEVTSRAGLTKEFMHTGITLLMPWKREITLPSRKANVAAQIVETMWVLAGRNDVAGLSHYLPRAADFSDDGVNWRAGYGARLRDYHGVDQLAYLFESLKAGSGTRQAVATIWDPTVDTQPGKDIACNNWINASSRLGKLDLHIGIRSNDVMWGWSGINAFEWSVLQEILAGMLGLMVGSLHFSVTSFHLYSQHWDKARRISEEVAVPAASESPRFDPTGVDAIQDLDEIIALWFRTEQRIRTGQPVGLDVEAFPEPMMRSWLRVLQWYWSGDEAFLTLLTGTRLWHACLLGMKPAGRPQNPLPEILEATRRGPSFLDHVNALHAEKHAAYGDSWKRRGEAGILGNIARKVDRIGSGTATSDETQADTAIDLLVYLAKYHLWLVDLSGSPEEVEDLLSTVFPDEGPSSFSHDLDDVFTMTAGWSQQKLDLVDNMMEQAYQLAESLWS